jgi:glutamate racemase
MVRERQICPRTMNAPIGVFDSGVGGLSVLKALGAELPLENFIYIADSAHAPHGERDDAYVIARSRAITVYLVSQNIKALVIACNTATAAAVDLLRAEHPTLPIIGVEPALKPAVTLSKTGHIAVMATRSTLGSAKFQALMAAHRGLAHFTVVPCDGLADAIERSAETGDATETIAACRRITCHTGPFGTQEGHIDTLVLGCTHYPFAAAHLRRLVGPDVQLVDNGEAVARQTRRQLDKAGALLASPALAVMGNISLFSTGQTQPLQAAARHWLELKTSSETLHFL